MDVQPVSSGTAVRGSPEVPTSKLTFKAVFTADNQHPYDVITWKNVDAVIRKADGSVAFEQHNVEAPSFWSERAINIVAEKYFRMINGVKENSVKQLITRVARTIAHAGQEQGLFGAKESVTFELELTYMLVHQLFAFNSPVWFNIGVPGVSQQASACFINSVEDTMESITDLAKTEVMLFKGGSGAGTNLSKLRSSYELLSGGGNPSGPVSFMKMLDAGAGVTKSGGTTRRAALMRVLNVDHPDVLIQANGEAGFINCKTHAEKIAQALIAAGFSAEFNKPGNAYDLSPFQNANNSVRVTDFFMRKVQDDQAFQTKSRTTGETVHTYKARELWDDIAKAAHASGDPGLQFDTSTNKWHTLPNTGKINSSNPCSEFLHLDDTSCNLGSFNLLKFNRNAPPGQGAAFDVTAFVHATEVAITGMEILCGYADYPTESITKHTKASRPLGIGYANLGSLLMVKGLAYDSPEGREFAAGITALMSGAAYRQSARMAKAVGVFDYFNANKKEMLEVIALHKDAVELLPKRHHASIKEAVAIWHEAYALGKEYGYRNSQVSVLAPTGTIGFMMDCDTTGVEPMIALVQYKKLVGGGHVKMPNRCVHPALRQLGYEGEVLNHIIEMLETAGEFPVHVSAAHKKVFQTAIGTDPITTEGHLLMMAAVQPFLSGGISKTVNMANSATVGDVANVYMRAWELGLKCVAIYRDGCKASQPVSSKAEKTLDKAQSEELKTALKKTIKEFEEGKPTLRWGERKRLPDDRNSITHKFSVGGQDGYLHLGLYEDGSPGEVFINISKAGSTLHGLVDMAATAISVGLQHGVPLNTMLEKFRGMRFEPSGFTGNKAIPRADSLADYFAKWMELRESVQLPVQETQKPATQAPSKTNGVSYHGDPCRSCGNITVRAGSCWVCNSCGTTTGCG